MRWAYCALHGQHDGVFRNVGEFVDAIEHDVTVHNKDLRPEWHLLKLFRGTVNTNVRSGVRCGLVGWAECIQPNLPGSLSKCHSPQALCVDRQCKRYAPESNRCKWPVKFQSE